MILLTIFVMRLQTWLRASLTPELLILGTAIIVSLGGIWIVLH